MPQDAAHQSCTQQLERVTAAQLKPAAYVIDDAPDWWCVACPPSSISECNLLWFCWTVKYINSAKKSSVHIFAHITITRIDIVKYTLWTPCLKSRLCAVPLSKELPPHTISSHIMCPIPSFIPHAYVPADDTLMYACHLCRIQENGGWQQLRGILCNLLHSSPEERCSAAEGWQRVVSLLKDMKTNHVL